MSFDYTRSAWENNAASLIREALKEKVGLPALRFVVLLCLADHADETGVCWPSHARISKKTGLSRRTVGDCLRDLEELGLIERAPQSKPDGGKSSDRITVLLPIEKAPPANLAMGSENGKQRLQGGTARVAEKPVREPLGNEVVDRGSTSSKAKSRGKKLDDELPAILGSELEAPPQEALRRNGASS